MLFQITNNEGSNFEFIVNECRFDENYFISSTNSCWFVLKKSKIEENANKYKIHAGDILRFGRVIIRIKEIKIKKNKNLNINEKETKADLDPTNNKDKIHKISKKKTEPNLHIITLSSNSKIKKVKTNFIKEKMLQNNKASLIDICLSNRDLMNKIPKICRICLSEEDPLNYYDDPLVQPCKCSGSMKYIHINCLKQWLNTKSCIKIENNHYFSFFLIKPVICELCQTKFPDYIEHKGKLYEILDFQSEFEYYFIIESLTMDKNDYRFIYVISLNQSKKLKIGRSNEVDLVFGDISVSRIHSILTIENKNIYLEDNNSKFGTLILVQTPTLKLVNNLPLYIQVGRTFFDCRIKRSYNLFSCCGVFDSPNADFYYQQNEKKIDSQKMTTIKTEMDSFDTEQMKFEEKISDKKFGENISEKDNLFNKAKLKLSLKEDDSKNNDDKSEEEEEMNLTTYKKYRISICSNNTIDNKKKEESINKKDNSDDKSQSIFLENEIK